MPMKLQEEDIVLLLGQFDMRARPRGTFDARDQVEQAGADSIAKILSFEAASLYIYVRIVSREIKCTEKMNEIFAKLYISNCY